MAKELAQTSIVTVVSFDGSSSNGYKIAMRRTDGSRATLIELAAVSEVGMTFIRAHDLSRMFVLSGASEIEANLATGNNQLENQNEHF
jgi:hypothetical protein